MNRNRSVRHKRVSGRGHISVNTLTRMPDLIKAALVKTLEYVALFRGTHESRIEPRV